MSMRAAESRTLTAGSAFNEPVWATVLLDRRLSQATMIGIKGEGCRPGEQTHAVLLGRRTFAAPPADEGRQLKAGPLSMSHRTLWICPSRGRPLSVAPTPEVGEAGAHRPLEISRAIVAAHACVGTARFPQLHSASSSSITRDETDDEGVISEPEYTLTKPLSGPNHRDHLTRSRTPGPIGPRGGSRRARIAGADSRRHRRHPHPGGNADEQPHGSPSALHGTPGQAALSLRHWRQSTSTDPFRSDTRKERRSRLDVLTGLSGVVCPLLQGSDSTRRAPSRGGPFHVAAGVPFLVAISTPSAAPNSPESCGPSCDTARNGAPTGGTSRRGQHVRPSAAGGTRATSRPRRVSAPERHAENAPRSATSASSKPSTPGSALGPSLPWRASANPESCRSGNASLRSQSHLCADAHSDKRTTNTDDPVSERRRRRCEAE